MEIRLESDTLSKLFVDFRLWTGTVKETFAIVDLKLALIVLSFDLLSRRLSKKVLFSRIIKPWLFRSSFLFQLFWWNNFLLNCHFSLFNSGSFSSFYFLSPNSCKVSNSGPLPTSLSALPPYRSNFIIKKDSIVKLSQLIYNNFKMFSLISVHYSSKTFYSVHAALKYFKVGLFTVTH